MLRCSPRCVDTTRRVAVLLFFESEFVLQVLFRERLHIDLRLYNIYFGAAAIRGGIGKMNDPCAVRDGHFLLLGYSRRGARNREWWCGIPPHAREGSRKQKSRLSAD